MNASEEEVPPGQRSPDEVTISVAATVHTLDEALVWVVRKVDELALEAPSITISPVWGYTPPEVDDMDGEVDHVLVEIEQFFEVSVSGGRAP